MSYSRTVVDRRRQSILKGLNECGKFYFSGIHEVDHKTDAVQPRKTSPKEEGKGIKDEQRTR